MAFQKLPGGKGLIYIPKLAESEKKYPCPDCFSCQWCEEQRCRACRAKVDRPDRGVARR